MPASPRLSSTVQPKFKEIFAVQRKFLITFGILLLVALTFGVVSAQTEATTEPAAFPVTITHSQGTIEIPAPPERVIVLGLGDIDTAYGLGYTPVAILSNSYSDDGTTPWLDGTFDADATVLLPSDTVNFEQITELDPDLILAGGFWGIGDAYENLSQIAPTTSWLTTNYGDSWQEQTLGAGRALDDEAGAQALVDETQAQIAAILTDYPELQGKTFSLSYLWSTDGIATIYSPDDFAVQFFNELGFQLTPGLVELEAAEGAAQGALSLETLNLIDADLMILAFDSPEVKAAYEANPLFQQLDAVKEGRYIEVDLTTITQLRTPSVLGIRWVLDQLRPSFEALSA
jgi:iron complex transport system substrate-binding protein